MIRGRPLLTFGGELLFYRDDTTAWGISRRDGHYTGVYTQSTVVTAAACCVCDSFWTDTVLECSVILVWSASKSPQCSCRTSQGRPISPSILACGIRFSMLERSEKISRLRPTVTNRTIHRERCGCIDPRQRRTSCKPIYKPFCRA